MMRSDRTLRGLIASGQDDAIAIAAHGAPPLTYARLSALVDSAVASLNRLGVGRGDRVAIVLPNGPEMATAFLAVAAGATSAPLNPAYRQDEFEFYLSDLNAKALIVEAGSASPAIQAAEKLGVALITLTPEPQAGAGAFRLTGASDRSPRARPGTRRARRRRAHPAHFGHHLAAEDRAAGARQYLGLGQQYRRCSRAWRARPRPQRDAPLPHSWADRRPRRAAVARRRRVLHAGVQCAQVLRRYGGGEAHLVHGGADHASGDPDPRRGATRRSSPAIRCRFIRSSSASLPPRVIGELEAVFHCPVIEAYGMTEATHQMASNPLRGVRKPGSVGLAAGPEIAVMDEAGRLLGPGVAGEVVIRGDNVTAAYENNAKANAEAFVNGWFRTGDQGVIDEEGYLTLTGRLKEIINRGGEKVSPREVDEALMDHPAVLQAVAFAVPHEMLGEDVAAAVVLREGMSASEAELRAFLSDRLAAFKAPRKILLLAEIPKGATGKLQRIGLAAKLGLAWGASGDPYAIAAAI